MSASSSSLHFVKDYEKAAERTMAKMGWDYYSATADDGTTHNECLIAYGRYYLIPRILRPVEDRILSTTVLGQHISFPVCISPTAYHKFAHQDGEKATAKAALSCDTLMVLSSWATTRLEDVAEFAPGGLRWMQSYMFRSRRLFKIIVGRAEANGYKALVLTVDDPIQGKQSKTIAYGMELFKQERLANFDVDLDDVRKAKAAGDQNLIEYGYHQCNSYPTREYVKWIKSITRLPIVLKGIISPESAREAVEAGVQGILVSAHGGRQLDGVPPPIEVLSQIVEIAKPAGIEVYIDGGVRTGTDVLKAIALGARAVFVGRPVLWGLAVKGEQGVQDVLEIYRDELKRAMSLTGCQKIEDIDSSLVLHKNSLQYISKL